MKAWELAMELLSKPNLPVYRFDGNELFTHVLPEDVRVLDEPYQKNSYEKGERPRGRSIII